MKKGITRNQVLCLSVYLVCDNHVLVHHIRILIKESVKTIMNTVTHKTSISIFYCLLFLGLCLLFLSCDQGCTDPYAVNFDNNADKTCKEDDCTQCSYSTIGFYLENEQLNDESDSTLITDSCSVIDSVHIYFENVFLGKIASPVYGDVSDICWSPDVVKIELTNGYIRSWYAKLFYTNCEMNVISFNLAGTVQSSYDQPCQTISVH